MAGPVRFIRGRGGEQQTHFNRSTENIYTQSFSEKCHVSLFRNEWVEVTFALVRHRVSDPVPSTDPPPNRSNCVRVHHVHSPRRQLSSSFVVVLSDRVNLVTESESLLCAANLFSPKTR